MIKKKITNREEPVERRFVESHLRHSTAVPSSHRLGAAAVPGPHADTLGQDMFQLRCRAARYQRSNQSQRVVVEIRLNNYHEWPTG